MNLYKLTLLTILLTLVNCSREYDRQVKLLDSNHIFGENNRVRVQPVDLTGPLRKIGILNYLDFNDFANSRHCTASLISDYLILTAAHCVTANGILLNKSKLTFKLGYTGPNEYLAKSKIEEIWVGSLSETSREDDWAILKLREPLGKEFGSLEIINPVTSEIKIEEKNLLFAGHSKEFNKATYLTMTDKFCSLRGYDEDNLIMVHDCDIAPGDSGGPLLYCRDDKQNCKIIGVLFSQRVPDGEKKQTYYLDEYDLEFANTAVSSVNFIEKIIELTKSH